MLLEALHQPQLKAAAASAIMQGISAGHLSGREVRRKGRVTLGTPEPSAAYYTLISYHLAILAS